MYTTLHSMDSCSLSGEYLIQCLLLLTCYFRNKWLLAQGCKPYRSCRCQTASVSVSAAWCNIWKQSIQCRLGFWTFLICPGNFFFIWFISSWILQEALRILSSMFNLPRLFHPFWLLFSLQTKLIRRERKKKQCKGFAWAIFVTSCLETLIYSLVWITLGFK